MDLTRRELIATVAGLVAAPLASAKPKPLYSWKHVKGGPVDLNFSWCRLEGLTFAEACDYLGHGEYIQRAGWGTRHVARTGTANVEGRQVSVCALHMYEGRRMTWFSYKQDKEASDWLVVAKKEETRPPVTRICER